MPHLYFRVHFFLSVITFFRTSFNSFWSLAFILVLSNLFIPLTLSAQVTFTSFEDARLVIGQPDFGATNTQVNNTHTVGATALAISNNGKLAVASQTPGRVLIWHTIPTSNGQPAEVVIGKPDFTSLSYTAPTATNMRGCEGVAFSPDGSKLLVSDGENNRVLIWNSIPTTNGQPADLVIGQPNFTSNTPGTTADKLRYPAGITVTPSGKLLINDAFNNRVLIFNRIPTTNNASADVVIGQTNLTSGGVGNTEAELNRPWNTAEAPDGKLIISDYGNHRVLIYNTIPTSNGAAANVVIGQTGFNTAPTAGTSSTKLKNPLGVSISSTGKLAIADVGNNRVLIYNTIPTLNGKAADVVLGQANFTSAQDYSAALTSKTLVAPNGVQFDFNGRLYVSGKQGSGQVSGRVLVFGLPTSSETDLSISSQASMNLPCQDITLQYQISVLNNGPTDVTNVSVNLVIPGELSLSATPAPSVGTFTASSGFWNIPALKIGQSATITFSGTISPNFSGRVIRQSAIITASSQTDNNLNNNASGTELTVINNKPDAPVVSDVTICTNNDTTLVASGSGTIRWYTIASGGTPIFTGNPFNTPNLTATTIYYVEAINSNNCAVSNRVPVRVTVNPAISNNTISGEQTLCQFSQPLNLSGSTPTGGTGTYTYQWQFSTDNSNWTTYTYNTNTVNFNPGGLGGTTFFRRRVISGPCTSTFSNSIKITINPLPAVSFTGLPEKTCTDSPTITLTGNPATGTFSGPGITGNTFNPAVAGVGRHVVQFRFTNNNNCTNTASAVIMVGASVFAGNDQTVCVDAAAFQLGGFSPMGGTWSGSGVSASGVFTPATAGVGDKKITYSVTSTFNCGTTSQTVTSTKTIRVVALPVLTLGNTRKVCVDTADFFLTGYTPLGGTWNGTGVRADGYFSPRTAGIGNHTLTYRFQDGNGCVNTATKVLQVTPLPAVTLEPFQKQCSRTYLPFALTGGFPAAGIYSGPGVNKNTFNPSAAGVGTHLITYTYKDANGCIAVATRPMVVEVCLPAAPVDPGTPTGIEEDKIKGSLTIAPNPARENFTIQFEVFRSTAIHLKLINLAGQVVFAQKYTRVSGKFNQELDVRTLGKGVYLLQIISEKAVVNQRVLLQ